MLPYIEDMTTRPPGPGQQDLYWMRGRVASRGRLLTICWAISWGRHVRVCRVGKYEVGRAGQAGFEVRRTSIVVLEGQIDDIPQDRKSHTSEQPSHQTAGYEAESRPGGSSGLSVGGVALTAAEEEAASAPSSWLLWRPRPMGRRVPGRVQSTLLPDWECSSPE